MEGGIGSTMVRIAQGVKQTMKVIKMAPKHLDKCFSRSFVCSWIVSDPIISSEEALFLAAALVFVPVEETFKTYIPPNCLPVDLTFQ